jgi:molybdate transport system substrate-binding protein
MRLGFWNVLVASALLVAALVLLLAWDSGADKDRKETLILYCAAGMRKPVEQIAEAYYARYGVKVELEFDGSGKLLAKMRAAPGRGDLFLAADESYIAQARQYELLAEAIPVAHMAPAIAVAPGNPRQIKSVADLHRGDVKLVLANPELASIGKSVQQLLTPSGDWQKLMARSKAGGAGVSLAGTVNEVAQAVKLGSADVGLVWDSTAREYGLEIVPAEIFAKTKQTVTIGVIKVSAGASAAALRFARYLTSRDQGMPAFEQAWFEPIADADEWGEDGQGGGWEPEVPVMIGAMLKPGVEEAIKRFEQREGVKILPVYNGCGILVSQIKTGQHAEMYFACDRSFLEMVEDRFEPGVELARNRLVIAVAKGNPQQIQSIQDFARGGLKLGLAHPVNSALGKLTDDLLRRLDLHEKTYDRNTVIHTDAGHMLVNQMRAGSLDACVVYKSNVLSSAEAAEKLELIDISQEQAIATQPLAISKSSTHRYLLGRLRDALMAEETASRFESLGFEWVHEEKKK